MCNIFGTMMQRILLLWCDIEFKCTVDISLITNNEHVAGFKIYNRYWTHIADVMLCYIDFHVLWSIILTSMCYGVKYWLPCILKYKMDFLVL